MTPVSMSRDVEPVPGTDTGATVARAEPSGMLTLRGDLGSKTLALAIGKACGCAIPERRRIETSGGRFVAWMSHDELLVRVPADELDSVLADLDEALGGENVLLSDVSDARVTFSITGPNARETLAKGCPSNLSHEAFGPGDFIRTRLGQVPVALWMPDPESVALMCFRSVGEFVGNWLENAAVGPFPGYRESGRDRDGRHR